MKCSTKNNSNIKTNKNIANKDKSKLKGVTAKSLLTNAANMKITKAIANSKQNRKNLHKAIINGAEIFAANEANEASATTATTTTTTTTESSSKSIGKRKELQEKDIEGQKTSFHNEQSPYPTKMLISNDSEPMTIAGCLLGRKEIEYRQEQRSPLPMQTVNSPQSLSTTTTSLLNEQIGPGRVHHFHNHHNHHQHHNQQQQQQQQQQQASESRFAANLNLSLLAGKSATLLSVVNETSNQTVLRTTTITNTTNEADSQQQQQHMKNFQLNKNEKDTVTNVNFDTAKSTNATAADKLQDSCNGGDVVETATAAIIHRHQQTTDKVNNKCNIESNNNQINRNDHNNSSVKSVINATAAIISENYQEKIENCEEFEKNLNNELQQQQQQQQPVNYRGVNNTVIITNYNHNAQQQSHHHHHHHQPHHHHHHHQQQQQQQHPENSFSVQTVEYDSQTSNILNSTSDPNLNLAVIGIPTPQSSNQTGQQHTVTSPQQQIQEHAHHYVHQPSTDQWLNVYNNCAYDLSLNHTQSVNDLTSQLLTSTLTQLHQHSHHHPHHTHHQNLTYYPAHLINPGAAITAATTLANASTYTLHDDTMRSNTTLYSTSYAPTGHEHLHQHTQLVGTTANTAHTPTNIDEVIQDTLKGECLDDHHSAVSYLTNLNSVVDAQTLKDTYHNTNLGHELSTLTAVAPGHLQSSNHLQTIHHLQQNNSVSSGANSPSPSSALSQTGDVATLQSFTQLTNANASSHRDIYGLLTTDQNSMSYFPSPPSPVLSQGKCLFESCNVLGLFLH
uniref:Uncharacterized protein n=1 Tax=Glossina brevipalpis TaxID=37001 RepID=A0A1A9WEK2_9MUSC